MRLPDSSIQGLETVAQSTRSLWSRRLALTVVAVLVAAGLAGFLGDEVSTRTSHESPWSVSVKYPRMSRAGLDVPWEVTVRRQGGFDKQIKLAVTSSYFDIYESQGFDPEPSDESEDGSTLYLTFEPPPSGDTFVLSFDAYIQPASQKGRSGTVSVLDAGRRVASTHFTTTLLP